MTTNQAVTPAVWARWNELVTALSRSQETPMRSARWVSVDPEYRSLFEELRELERSWPSLSSGEIPPLLLADRVRGGNVRPLSTDVVVLRAQIRDVNVGVGWGGWLDFVPIWTFDNPQHAQGWWFYFRQPRYLQTAGVLVGDVVLIKGTVTEFAGSAVSETDDNCILGPIIEARNGSERQLDVPRTCPDCGGRLKMVAGHGLLCTNHRLCPPQAGERLTRVAKELLTQPSGHGDPLAQILALLEAGLIADEGDLFHLTPQLLMRLPLFTTSPTDDGHSPQLNRDAMALLVSLERARQAGLLAILNALSIRYIFGPTGRSLAREFGTLDAIANASLAELTAIDYPLVTGPMGVTSATVARSVYDWFQEDWHRAIVERWRLGGVQAAQGTIGPRIKPLTGVCVALGGTIPGFTHSGAATAIESRGGTVSAAVTRRCDVFVTGDRAGARHDRALTLGVPIVDQEGLRTLLDLGIGAALRLRAPNQEERMVTAAHPGIVRVGSRGLLPQSGAAARPGVLYVFHEGRQDIDVVLADSLHQAIAHLNDPIVAGSMSRRRAYWAAGDRNAIAASSPALKRVASAGRPGRPPTVRSPEDWPARPHGAGVYRIYILGQDGVTPDVVYIGRTSDFRDRPRQHDKIPRNPDGSQRWGGPGGVDRIELIYAKSDGVPGVWSSVDLDDLEELHIKRARSRHLEDPVRYPRVMNDTDGRNGPPSRSKSAHYYNWAPS